MSSSSIVYLSELEEIKNTICEDINENPTFWSIYVLQNGDTISSIGTDIENDVVIMYHKNSDIESIEINLMRLW